MIHYLGIDGGGSTLRLALTDAALTPIRTLERGTANPGVIGHEAAAALIADAIRVCCGDVTPDAVGIGIAGASPAHSDDWLRATVAAALPGVVVATAPDVELGLIAAHGDRQGGLLLAGTGSVAYGIAADGTPIQIGGWGYLLGDEGGGFWIGRAALHAVAALDRAHTASDQAFARRVLDHLGLAQPRDLIAWTYRQPLPVREIAALTDVVFAACAAAEAPAVRIVTEAAEQLERLGRALLDRLPPDSPLAVGGGLLTAETPLRGHLLARLPIDPAPPLYPPAIGAARLGQIKSSHE